MKNEKQLPDSVQELSSTSIETEKSNLAGKHKPMDKDLPKNAIEYSKKKVIINKV
ncbi:MAG: hypothetical protein LBT09_04405 [Planctomycetaceae bacterium]|nr:hypothetical protein [Planctomycetaceae bacterium]